MGRDNINLPQAIAIEYYNKYSAVGKGYLIILEAKGEHFVSDFRDLWARVSVECGFGSEHEIEHPKYDLVIHPSAKSHLGEAGVNLLEALVTYHNHIVEQGKQNQGG